MNNNSQQGSNPDQNAALAFLAQAADLENQQRQNRDNAAAQLEQLLLQRHQQENQFGAASAQGFLGQIHDQNLLAQLQQQQQLAQLLGGGGLGGAGTTAGDLRSTLLSQSAYRPPLQTQPGLSEADLITLIRSGASPAMIAGLVGNNSAATLAALGGQAPRPAPQAPEGLESLHVLQRLEELQRADALRQLQQQLLQQQPLQQAVTAASRENAVEDMPSPLRAVPIPTKDPDMVAGDGLPALGDSTREEIEKAPGSVIVPCRARGMPMDHNFKTAYFVIPENVRHGEELICSYFACRNAGIKFRYCSHCKVPVAKRNFRKRHKHGGEDLGLDDDSDDEYVPPSGVNKKGIPSSIMASNRESIAEADGISSQSNDSTDQVEKVPAVIPGAPMTVPAARVLPPGADATAKPSAVAIAQNGMVAHKIDSERQERWTALLSKRPLTKEGDAMSAWLMEVLAVSDLDTPLRTAEETAADAIVAASSAKKRKSESDGLVAALGFRKKAADEAATNADEQREKAGFCQWKLRGMEGTKEAEETAGFNGFRGA